MAINLYPRAAIQPVQAQTGGIRAGVEPMRDATGQQLQALGRGIGDLGEAATKIADVMQDDVDMATSARMTNLLSEEVRKALEDPDEGYLSKVGMAAGPEARKAAFERISKAQRAIAAMGQNKVQQLNFQIQSDRLLSSAALMADRHQEHQAKVYRAGEMKQLSETTIGEAIRLAGTEEGEAAKIAALRHVDDVANTYGWPEDSAQRKGFKVDTLTKIHSGVIDTMLANSRSDLARDYLSKVPEGEMDPQQLARAKSMVQDATDSDHAAQLADFFYGRGMSFDDAEQSAQMLYERKEISLAVRDGAVDRHRARLRNQQNERDRVRSTTLRDAADFAAVNRATVVSFETLPHEMQTALKQSGGADAMRTFFARGGQRITTAAGQNFMADVAANPARLRQFPTVDAMQAALFNDLDADDMRRASEYWGKVTAPGKPSDTLDDGQVTTSIYLKMREAGLIPDDTKGRGDAEKQIAADRAKRLQLAVELQAKQLGGEHWRSQKYIDEAWKIVTGPEIRNAAGQTMKMAMMSKAELDAPGVHYMTDVGEVRGGAIGDEVTQRMLRIIEAENALLPVDSPARQGTQPQDIARRYRIELNQQEEIRRQVIRANWNPPDGGWWNSSFGFSRSRYESARSAAEKKIMEELNSRKIPYQVDDIRARM